MHCIICGNEISDCRCARCGFDLSLSRECFPTLNSDGETLQALWVKRNELYLNQQSAGAAGMKTEAPASRKAEVEKKTPGSEPQIAVTQQGDTAGSPDDIPTLVLELFESVKDKPSFKALRNQAEGGNKIASLALGLCFLTGRSIHQNSSMGFSNLRVAAIRNEPFAQYLLGLINEMGLFGLEKDSLRIYKWYSSAAQLGDVPSMLRLADLKEQGTLKGTPKEISKLRAEAQGESASRAISRKKIEKLLFDSSKGFESRNQYQA